MSDRLGARRVMYWTFTTILLASGVLMMPYGYIVLTNPDGSSNEVMPWSVGVVLFAVLVFIIGCAMGIGKAAVYKHIPEYFPRDVGAVGGLVGSLGALGGFCLPLLFAYAARWTGMPQSTFFVLFAVTAVAMAWMHLTIHRMLHAASPQLANKFENDQLADPAAAHDSYAEPVAVGATTTERMDG
jgi:NNP family nitrate/nitrite transporter-like MFS transporter